MTKSNPTSLNPADAKVPYVAEMPEFPEVVRVVVMPQLEFLLTWKLLRPCQTLLSKLGIVLGDTGTEADPVDAVVPVIEPDTSC